jgi:hypothetical protein
MRIRLETVDLVGSGRRVQFTPGLNIVTGPITTGKTTLLRLCRALLSTNLTMAEFPREAKENISAVAGQVLIGDTRYSIVRPLVSTATAKVDIASEAHAWRLPAHRPDNTSDMTYNQWLLQVLALPDLRVPSAPTEPASEPTPVTINDYFLYCRLTQDEIDSAVFASSDNYRDIKRRYVFEILYGIFSAEMAQLQEQLRMLLAKIRQLQVQTDAFQYFLEGTPWENRAALARNLSRAREELATLDKEETEFAEASMDISLVNQTRDQIGQLDVAIDSHMKESKRELDSTEQLALLINQLEEQIAKITRAIVAESLFNDIEFNICPRCGTGVSNRLENSDICLLCLQTPMSQSVDRKALIEEQYRIAIQVQEARELVAFRAAEISRLERNVADLQEQRLQSSRELDHLTESFVSDRASAIARVASNRAAVRARIDQISDYQNLFTRLDQALGTLASLNEERQAIELQLDTLRFRSDLTENRIRYLESEFADLVDIFRIGKPVAFTSPRDPWNAGPIGSTPRCLRDTTNWADVTGRVPP